MAAVAEVRVVLNGERACGLPFTDRGLAYGDGLFETIKVQGRPQFLELHLARLSRGCQRLDIKLDLAALRCEITALLQAEGSGTLKLIVTRAAGQRGYKPSPGAAAQRVLLFSPQEFAEGQRSAARLRICRQTLSEQPSLAGLKHLNRLEQVLARGEWSDPHIDEGLMLDTRGRLIEGTMSNVFLVRGNTLFTPALTRCGIEGVMRQVVIEHLAMTTVSQCDLTLDDLITCDGVFVTNSLLGIWPVAQIDCLHKGHCDVIIALQRRLQTLIDNETA